MPIQRVTATQIYDSRGNPTIKVTLETERGQFHAQVPSGASKGSYEALELRDGGSAFGGKGVSKAVRSVNEILGPALVQSGLSPVDQQAVDKLLRGLDGTSDKSKLGANAILGISMASCRAGASEKEIQLFEHIADLHQPDRDQAKPFIMPVPCTNQLNGGVHSGNALAPQEFMVLPVGARSMSQAMQIASECYQSLKEVIIERYGRAGTGIGDEGGFAPPVSTPQEALDLLMAAATRAGHQKEVEFAIDPASSEFFKEGSYDMDFKSNEPKDENKLSPGALTDLYLDLLHNYPIHLLEDPFAEDDWESWTDFTAQCGKDIEIVGDDLLATNTQRIKMAIERKACNSLLLKINQIGTISEAIEAAQLAFANSWSVFVSHRSGETTDDFIADLAVGLQTGHLKSGAPCRGERIVKYLRLMEIETHLAGRCSYAGRDFRLAHSM